MWRTHERIMTQRGSPPAVFRYQKLEIGRDARESAIKHIRFYERDFASRKNSIFAARLARTVFPGSRFATYKRISAGIVARITLAVNSFTIHRVHSFALALSLPLSALAVLPPKSTSSLPFAFPPSPGPGIVHLSSISRRVHFIFANGCVPASAGENL